MALIDIRTYVVFTKDQTAITKTEQFIVSNRRQDVTLGRIKFMGRWRCFVFHPEAQTIFDYKCLAEINQFLNERTQEWRKSL